MENDLILGAATARVTYLDIVVHLIINMLYIPIIYLLASQSISLSMYLSITRHVGMSVMPSLCLFVSVYMSDYLLSCVSRRNMSLTWQRP